MSRVNQETIVSPKMDKLDKNGVSSLQQTSHTETSIGNGQKSKDSAGFVSTFFDLSGDDDGDGDFLKQLSSEAHQETAQSLSRFRARTSVSTLDLDLELSQSEAERQSEAESNSRKLTEKSHSTSSRTSSVVSAFSQTSSDKPTSPGGLAVTTTSDVPADQDAEARTDDRFKDLKVNPMSLVADGDGSAVAALFPVVISDPDPIANPALNALLSRSVSEPPTRTPSHAAFSELNVFSPLFGKPRVDLPFSSSQIDTARASATFLTEDSKERRQDEAKVLSDGSDATIIVSHSVAKNVLQFELEKVMVQAIKQYKSQTNVKADLDRKKIRESLLCLETLIDVEKLKDLRSVSMPSSDKTEMKSIESSRARTQTQVQAQAQLQDKITYGVLVAFIIGGVGGWSVNQDDRTSLRVIMSQLFIGEITHKLGRGLGGKNIQETFKVMFKEAIFEEMGLTHEKRKSYPLFTQYVSALITAIYQTAAKQSDKKGEYPYIVRQHVIARIDSFLELTIDGKKISEYIRDDSMPDLEIMRRIRAQKRQMESILQLKNISKTYYLNLDCVDSELERRLDKDKGNKTYWKKLYSMTKNSYAVWRSSSSKKLGHLLDTIPDIELSTGAEPKTP